MRLRLRRTTDGDLDYVMAAERKADNVPFVGQWTREQHTRSLDEPDVAHLLVERLDDHHSVGYIIMAGLKNPNLNIEFRRLVISEKDRGYGTEAIRQVKQMAFDKFDAHRLWLDVRTNNPRALYVYEKSNFIREGTLRECVKVGNTYESLIIMSILRSEYLDENID